MHRTLKIHTLLFVFNGILLASGFTVLLFVCLWALESTAVDQTEANLKSFAHSLAKIIPQDKKNADTFIKELTHSDNSFRITLINQDGTVAADSVSNPSEMENHSYRKEVRLALSGKEASSIHTSSTNGKRFMYYAIPLSANEVFSALRISMPVEETVFFSSSTKNTFVISTILIFALVLLVSFYISSKTVRPIFLMKKATEEYAKGNFDFHLNISSPQEMAELAQSFNSMKDRITQNIQSLKKVEQIRKDFVANVSHELKTPVTSIKGFTETLLDDGINEPETAKHFLGIINTQCERLINIIEDLLTLSRLETDNGVLETVKTNLVQIAKKACSNLESAASEKQIKINFSSNKKEIFIKGNPGLLEQVITNLIDNSVKYCPDKSIVSCSISENSGKTKIIVEDNGNGIPDEYKDRIFERFYRVDKGRSREHGGTGLGLSIARHIVNIHGGTIKETGRPDKKKGAHFEIELPL
ncbi:ATP-binding protein [uncultured Treponema sp.]|uniref:HAMP domain-containing sensor histidine kinase n=1 Tax=uncultured Treponema sp. TaxID=162155 RepID=UPI0025D21EF2|nr:ATP-binding protein [uncultured Treponema sp.]